MSVYSFEETLWWKEHEEEMRFRSKLKRTGEICENCFSEILEDPETGYTYCYC